MEKDLDIIIPICLELDWPTKESIVESIMFQHKNYGFTSFTLSGPSGGWRSKGYPPEEHFINLANILKAVKEEIVPFGIRCGWWNTLTVKTGPSEEFIRQVKPNGESHPFASCPLDPSFRKRLSSDMALFCKVAKPDFVVLEDDFSIKAADGCFCHYHLDEFSKRQGRHISREELVEIIRNKRPEDIEIVKAWRELLKDSLVGMAKCIRAEVDKESPEIPIGSMQAGGSDFDGDCTEEIARALAGKNHTPFSRLYGAFYGGIRARSIPETLYHPLYSKQHMGENFTFYHESDTFPHTRFYTSGAHMRSIMAAVYSYGFDGSTFQTQQLLDDANEETAYGKMLKKERARFNTVYRTLKNCEVKGVEINYDPFINTYDNTVSVTTPLWTECAGRFGIPYTSINSPVAFWDLRQAKYYDDETVMKYLSKGLFLDGEAALHLCKRGFGKYLGAEVTEDLGVSPSYYFDLGAREVICEKFASYNKGINMPSAHMYSPPGNGRLLKISVKDKNCEVISEVYTFDKKCIGPAMTRFENELSGRIVIMGETIDRNKSQSLFNYRRQRLFQELLKWCCDKFVYAENAPEIYLIENTSKKPWETGFREMLTIINLCEDSAEDLKLYFPEDLREFSSVMTLNESGEWEELSYEKTEDGIILNKNTEYLAPVYILIK